VNKTLTDLLTPLGITVADETIAALDVPILTGVQRQGDVLVVPRKPLTKAEKQMAQPVGAKPINVVVGEATGNAHMLQGEGEVTWQAKTTGLLLGILTVSAGAVAWLIHTDEHGANGIGPGCYELHGKQEMADELRRVAD
jgi:hypothetical protein